MPKVVIQQMDKYNRSELFTKLKVDSPIVYVGHCNLTSGEDRQRKFLRDLQHQKIEIAFTTVGLTLMLQICEAKKEDNRVQIRSDFTLDGVCVKLIGELNCTTLHGVGRLEYDSRRADMEQENLRAEWQQYRHLLAKRQMQYAEQTLAGSLLGCNSVVSEMIEAANLHRSRSQALSRPEFSLQSFINAPPQVAAAEPNDLSFLATSLTANATGSHMNGHDASVLDAQTQSLLMPFLKAAALQFQPFKRFAPPLHMTDNEWPRAHAMSTMRLPSGV